MNMNICLVFLLLVAYVTALAEAATEEAVTFTLYDNGSSFNGKNVTLTETEFEQLTAVDDNDKDAPPGEAFAMAMSSRIEVSKHNAPKPVLATRAFREDGELVTDFQQLQAAPADEEHEHEQQEGHIRRVYLVAEGLEFVWPFIEVGHRQVVSSNIVPPTDAGPLILESVAESPRVFRVFNMASEDEANAIIQTALNATGKNELKRSTVGSGKDEDGNEIAHEDRGRTSHNAWDHESDEAKLMITRSFQLTNIEENDGKRDGLQIVRYTPGQGYNTHPDYFTPGKSSDDKDFDFNPYSGGSNRFATVFMYLNDPEEGGCTVFPRAPGVGPAKEMPPEAKDMFKVGTWEHTVNRDCYEKLAVPPKLGTAALFYSITPDGRIDPMSHHAACPLIKGTKWGANIWIWNKQRFGDLRTGDPRTVVMKNSADDTVYISWEGRANGSIEPGNAMQMNSFEYHRFKASFDSHKHKNFAEFTVQSEPETEQIWEIKQPRHFERNALESDEDQEARQRIVMITNLIDSEITIRWKETDMMSLAPGESTNLNTFKGHSFDVAVDDEIIETYVVKESPKKQIWIVRDEDSEDDEEYDADIEDYEDDDEKEDLGGYDEL